MARKAELETHGAKLVLVAVLSDGETTEDARAVLTSWGVSVPFLVDRDGILRLEAAVTDLPAALGARSPWSRALVRAAER